MDGGREGRRECVCEILETLPKLNIVLSLRCPYTVYRSILTFNNIINRQQDV